MPHIQGRSNFIVSVTVDTSYKQARHFAVPGLFYQHATGDRSPALLRT